MMRRPICDEGLLCGGSSGAAVAGTIKAIQQHLRTRKIFSIVILLPVSVRNYMTKALNGDWMSEHGLSN
jgi:cystathionine beta-synthase